MTGSQGVNLTESLQVVHGELVTEEVEHDVLQGASIHPSGTKVSVQQIQVQTRTNLRVTENAEARHKRASRLVVCVDRINS